MGIRPSGEVNDPDGSQYAIDAIGHVYTNVRIVAENIDEIIAVSGVTADMAIVAANIATISEAVDSAAAAAASATAAGTSATNAAASATSADTSEANALTYRNAAQASATAAATSETNALSYKNLAETFKNSASASAIAAALSETNAAASAVAAANSAATASTHKDSAAGSATAAASSATSATNSATLANTKAGESSTSAAAALAAQIAAELARDEAEAIAGGDYIPTSQKGAASGVAPLGVDSKISVTYLPDSVLGALQYQGTWNATTNSPAIPAAGVGNKGYYYIVSVAGTTSIDGENDWQIGDWIVSNGVAWGKVDNSDKVSSVAGLTGVITGAALKTAMAFVKGDVGLGNVDNTSDLNKPVSTATQTALNAKLDDSQAGTFGLTLLGSLDITAAKTALSYTKGDVGLGNADNTSDANKPVSTAQQTALDLKANLAGSNVFTGAVIGSQDNANFIARGGGTNGGQLILGYGDGLATAITGQASNTWNIDVPSGNAFRIWRTDASATNLVAFSIAEATGKITNIGGITTSGDLATTGAAAGLYLGDRDLTGTIVLYNQGDQFRVFINGAERFTVDNAGNAVAGGSITATGNLIGPDVTLGGTSLNAILNNKAQVATTLAGYGITDGATDAELAAAVANKADAFAAIGSFSTNQTAAESWNNSHRVASGASRTLTLNSTPAAGTSFSVRFTTAWTITCTSLSKNGATPASGGSVAAGKLVTFLHEGSGTWLASGDIT